MHKLYIICFVTYLALSAGPINAATTAADKPLEVGVVPYISARVVVASYEPMRLYLEKALHRPVKLYTSTSFKSFFQNTQRGDYDLVITPAHFARILQKDNRFTPLARYAEGGRSLIMTTLVSPLKTVLDLRGKIIAVPDQLSLSAIICMTYLRENGLKAGIDYHILEVPSFASAILSMQKGDANAAVSAEGALAQMPRELRESVRPVFDAGEYLSLIFLSHPRLEAASAEQLKNELLKFANVSDEGKQFFSSNSFGSIVVVTPKDMNSLDRYIPETKRLLDAKP